MDGFERGEYLDRLRRMSAMGEITVAEVVRKLRVEVTGLDEERFAAMCRIPVQSLVHIERGELSSTKLLDSVLKPFGMQIGVVRRPSVRN